MAVTQYTFIQLLEAIGAALHHALLMMGSILNHQQYTNQSVRDGVFSL
jgi:hypothetical protein